MRYRDEKKRYQSLVGTDCWVGVDLDGTLARTGDWKPGDPEHTIGEPVPLMVRRVKAWLEAGVDVRIFTARASRPDPKIIPAIETWSEEVLGKVLLITDRKDYTLVEFWDDRAVGVRANTGRVK